MWCVVCQRVGRVHSLTGTTEGGSWLSFLEGGGAPSGSFDGEMVVLLVYPLFFGQLNQGSVGMLGAGHVGAAGVCIVSLWSAPVTLTTYATAQFQKFYCQGRAVRYVLLIGGGRVMHFVVLCGDQGADKDSEQLCLTFLQFDGSLCELEVLGKS